ncbi:Digeranylgeranylglycerophospholipid reductase [Frankliniella fusca]|uniref:Digeranylgeranylglycerophospholipid reductase n=1 Tax=Frankliniella fusca TaxID=407009 RepID=A0AAE1I2D4_9NEOP|nr:Digeranylgeranylglycerophospholipid reductase [Frankliniella fusca]KAK3931675.1 Digeranylgeranylglycerophospholipid reductase [Frankliniella fusca]
MEGNFKATCPIQPKCGVFCIQTLKVHLGLCHKFDFERQSLECKERGCSRCFKNWGDFRRHVQTHRLRVGKPSGVAVESDVVEDLESNSFPDDTTSLGSSETGPSLDAVKLHMRQVFLGLVGKMYSVPKIPRSFVQNIVLDIISLFEESVAQVSNLSASAENIDFVETSPLNSFKEILSVLNEFRTEYRRLQIMQKTGNFIKPRPYTVGSEVKEKRVDGRIVKELIPLTGQFVPIRKVLECFFSMPGVFEEVMDYVNKLENETFGILEHFIHGSLWKFKVTKFFPGKLVLPLLFYHDECEINNPLGSHAVIQKLGGTYFNCPCLPPEHRSKLANIFLAMLTYASDRKASECTTMRNAQIFRVLVNQINDLQRHGIIIRNGSEVQTLYFGFGLLLGDNEGLNNCQDFASASSHCRICRASPAQIRVDEYERPHLLRFEEDYEADIRAGYKISGIKRESVWNEIEGHHIYSNFSVDLLHDLEEGTLKYGMFHVVNHFVNNAKRRVSLEILNDRLKTFNYYDNGISNKPQLISDRDLNIEQRLKMSGSEMHNFTLIFAMLVGDLINVADKVWQYYILLRKIVHFVYAPEVQTESIDSFDHLIASHHRLYKRLFKDTLKPKYHNLVHYARIMKQSGPLSYLSTFRYEARHKPIKEAAAATASRRDSAYTLALKDQLALCYRLSGNQGLTNNLQAGPSFILSAEEQSDLCLPEKYGDVMEIAWVEFKGTRYHPNMCICHSIDESDGLPQFGRVEKILCDDKLQVLLYYRNFTTLFLEYNLFAYAVQEENSYDHVCLDVIPMYSPVMSRAMGDGDIFMTLKHAL